MKALLFSLLIVPLVGISQQPTTPADLIQQLRVTYEEIAALKDKETLAHKVAHAQSLAKQVYEHADATELEKQSAVAMEGYCLYAATNWDEEKYLESYREVVGRILTMFPAGHSTAAEAEIYLIQFDYFPAVQTGVPSFVSTMENFASTYPDHSLAAYTMALFARELYFDGAPFCAGYVLDEGLRLFPENKNLKNMKSLFELQGTEAKLLTQTFSGEAFDLATLKGKVVLLDFWATWCGPCRELAPKLEELYAKYKDQGFEIVGFSKDYRKEDLEKYLSEHPHPWIQLFEPDLKVQMEISNQFFISWIPTIFIVGKDGNFHTVGLSGEIERIEQKVLEALAQ